MRRWKVEFPANPRQWIHLIITWHQTNGIKVYTNGKKFSEQKKSLETFRESSSYLPVVTMARPNSPYNLNEYGKFGITTTVIWLRELSVADAMKAFQASETIKLWGK